MEHLNKLLLTLILLPFFCGAQNIIPTPEKYTLTHQEFRFNSEIFIDSYPKNIKAKNYLIDFLKPVIKLKNEPQQKNTITLKISSTITSIAPSSTKVTIMPCK